MKFWIPFSLLFLGSIQIKAQEFAFEMYFNNPMGSTDTVTIGYDPNATSGIDQKWGERNILDRAYNEGLGVRISDALPERMDQISFQSKINIIPILATIYIST